MTPSNTQPTPPIDTPPEAYTFQSDKEENITSNIHENTSNLDSNVNIGVTTSEPPSAFVPLVSPSSNAYFIVGDEAKSLDDFSIPNFNF